MSGEEWTALLDRLEQEAEQILDAAPGAAADADLAPWTPLSTPLPAELADRARRVIDLQRSAMDRARSDLDGMRRHLGAVSRIPSTRRPEEPAYLDVDG